MGLVAGVVMFSEMLEPVTVCPGMVLLPRFSQPVELRPLLDRIMADAPLRHMKTPGGHSMAAAMTNCGRWGWVSDRAGYRYAEEDPDSGLAWPAMPDAFLSLAANAAEAAGYPDFVPDACLVNCYRAGAGMGAHQDKNESDFSQPIVSVSLGLPARFFVQGAERKGKSTAFDLQSGDVLVFGGESRLFYHGVRPLKPGTDSVYGDVRINLTMRRAY